MAWDKIWEQIFQSHKWGRYPPEDLIRFIAQYFFQRNRRETKLLEIGPGVGANIWFLCREGFDVYAIDGSMTAINSCKASLRREKLSAHLEIGDVMKLPYPNDFFDGVIDVECIYSNNYDDSEIILSEIQRVIKNNGLFFSKTFSDKINGRFPHQSNKKYEFRKMMRGPLKGKGFVRLLPKKHIKKLYGKYFDLISIDLTESTRNNGLFKISEWIIVSRKR